MSDLLTDHPRKAMVMIGESVLNDVDKEVYEGKGDDASVAKGSFGR